MKQLIIIALVLGMFVTGHGQAFGENSNPEKEKVQKTLLQLMVENRDFVFNATDMLPRGGGVTHLGYDFDVQIKDSMMVSYLPFVGTSYEVNFRTHNSGFDFSQPIESYKYKKRKKGYRVEVAVDNGSDALNYTFHITESGSSTLTVSSIKRQSISYFGTIDPVK